MIRTVAWQPTVKDYSQNIMLILFLCVCTAKLDWRKQHENIFVFWLFKTGIGENNLILLLLKDDFECISIF